MAEYIKTVALDGYFGTIEGQTPTGGDTILFEEGDHTGTMYFSGFHGTSKESQLIIDLNGQDVNGENGNIVFRLVNCSHIKVINGKLRNSITQGFYSAESIGVEVHNIEVYDTVGTAIRIGLQTQPSNTDTWRSNFPNTIVDDYGVVRNCIAKRGSSGAEGIYVGPSNGNSWYFQEGVAYQQAFMGTVEVCDNIVEDFDYDGIQVGGAILNVLIEGNRVSKFGSANNPINDGGIQIGINSRGVCRNNIIFDSAATSSVTGMGISIVGDGVEVYGNLIRNCYRAVGFLDASIMSNVTPGRSMHVHHNTMVDLKESGIYFNARNMRNCKIYGNIIHLVAQPSGLIKYISDVVPFDYKKDKNLFTYEDQNSKASLFTDPSGDDYTLKVGSVALNASTNKSFNLTRGSDAIINLAGEYRTKTGIWNQGAY